MSIKSLWMSEIDQESADMPFYNDWIDINDLPRINEAEFVGLDREYLYVRLSSVMIMTILGGIMLILFLIFSSWTTFGLFGLLSAFLVLMILWALLVFLEFRYRGYSIRSQDIAYRSGYIFRHRQYLPFRRVQHCKISEGLIDRLFNFSTVIISAAGDDIVINGLRPDEALALQQLVNEKVDMLTKEMGYGRD